jgi:hypothetical protein
MKLRVLLPALLMSSLAMADASQQGSQGAVGQESAQLTSLKDKCAELTANQQIKPFKIQVTCSETSFVWKPAQPSEFRLPNLREVGASARMKSFEFPFVGGAVQIDDTVANCEVLERHKVTIPAVDVELTCAELEEIQNFTDFCTPIIDERVEQDQGIMLTEKTGEVYNTCSGALSR